VGFGAIPSSRAGLSLFTFGKQHPLCEFSAERVVLPEQGTSGVIVEAGSTVMDFGSPSDSHIPGYVRGRFG
jgi:hypothetical protein